MAGGLLRSKPRVAVSESLLLLKDEYLYLKLFKDVLRCDVDMLLPGTVVKFMWYDWVSPTRHGAATVWSSHPAALQRAHLLARVWRLLPAACLKHPSR